MAAKNPQTQPGPPAPLPVLFDESLAARCFPLRFRLIGSPHGYLDEIGIVPILEFIYKGNLLIDVAEATNVPFGSLREWVEAQGHFEAVAEAETVSAEGWLARGQSMVLKAPTEFELRRAKEVLRHAQFMATKKNKPIYGEQVEKPKGNVVTYQFNIPDVKTATTILPVIAAIEGESHRIAALPANDIPRTVSLDMNTVVNPPKLVYARPVKPTAKEPDIGPFYDDPTDVENTELPVYG